MDKLEVRIQSLELTLYLIASVSLFATDHYISGGILLIMLMIGVQGFDEKGKKDEKEKTDAA
jgi:hypothetical protein